MHFYPKEPEIGDQEGFTSSNDLFRRKRIGDGLTHLIAASEDPLVIALNAQWGAGKTVFLKMWAGSMRQLGYPVIYFDAFANDYQPDAFAALAGEVLELIDERQKASRDQAEIFRAKALQVGKVLLRAAMHGGVKIATMNVLSGKDLAEAAKVMSEEIAALEDKYVGDLLTKRREEKSSREDFRHALSELPGVLRDGETAKADPKPLIFIIDELDRCRPTFALEMLERVKHFFSVPNVHFVMGVHLSQLISSVKAAYGAELAATTYLEKFFHLTVELTDHGTPSDRATSRYLAHILPTVVEGGSSGGGQTYELIAHVAEERMLSLRTIERIAVTAKIATAFSDPDWRPPLLVGGLAVLKELDRDLYIKARRGILHHDEVTDALRLRSGTSRTMEAAKNWWRLCTDPGLDEPELDQLLRDIGLAQVEKRFQIIPNLVRDVMDRLSPA